MAAQSIPHRPFPEPVAPSDENRQNATLSPDIDSPRSERLSAGEFIADLHNATPEVDLPHEARNLTMGSDAPKDSPRQTQLRVAVLLASGKSMTAAAEECGLHRSTIHRWLKASPMFQAAVDAARRDYVESLRDQVRDLSVLAIRTIEALLTDPKTPPSVRLRAALAVLQRPHDPLHSWHLPEPLTNTPSAAVHHNSTESNAFGAFAAARARQSVNAAAEPARNAPCPCGSGQKYKRCCGRNAPPVLGSAPAAA